MPCYTLCEAKGMATTMRTFRAAVIGAGKIAGKHMDTLRTSERTILTAVADIDRNRLEVQAAKYGAMPYTDYRDMIREQRPDIAVIALPHHLHKEMAIWCAEQGCHVLLEKPMAMNAKECAEINEAAARNGTMVAVGHMQHYFPANMKAKMIIQSQALGRLVMIQDRRHYPYFLPERPDWFLDRTRSGGGIVINLGSHSIDKIQWLTGSRIVKARAMLTYYGNRGDVEGSGSLFLETSQGVPVSISLCGYENVPMNETEFLFTGGQLKIKSQGTLWIANADREYERVDTGGLPEPFETQWNDVLDHLEHGARLDISGAYGQSVMAAIDAVYRSHASGKEQEVVEPVSTPDIMGV